MKCLLLRIGPLLTTFTLCHITSFATSVDHAAIPSDLELGTFVTAKDQDVTVPISNLTNSELTIDQIQCSCGCTSVSYNPGKVPPHGTAIAKLRLHPEVRGAGRFKTSVMVRLATSSGLLEEHETTIRFGFDYQYDLPDTATFIPDDTNAVYSSELTLRHVVPLRCEDVTVAITDGTTWSVLSKSDCNCSETKTETTYVLRLPAELVQNSLDHLSLKLNSQITAVDGWLIHPSFPTGPPIRAIPEMLRVFGDTATSRIINLSAPGAQVVVTDVKSPFPIRELPVSGLSRTFVVDLPKAYSVTSGTIVFNAARPIKADVRTDVEIVP